MLTAVAENRELIRQALHDGLYVKPHSRPITTEQKAAWEAFVKVMGNDGYVVEYEAIATISDNVMDAMMGRYEPRTDRLY